MFTLTFAPVLHTYCVVIVLTGGPAGGWINTSVSCLVKLPFGVVTCLISTLSIHYDIYSTTIVLTGGHTQSWSAITVFWLADTQKGSGEPMVNWVHCI